MNADQLNRWLTLVANLAVVAGIIFLALELRQNTIMQERQMQMDQISSLMEPYFTSPELARVSTKVKAIDGFERTAAAFMGRYELTPEEATLWSRVVHLNWYRQNAYFNFFGPSEKLESRIKGLWQYPDVRIAFELDEDDEFSPEFEAYVQSITADSQPR